MPKFSVKFISEYKKVRNLKSRNLKKKDGFVVIMTDEGKDRLYLKKLIRLIRKNELLVQAPASMRDKALSSTEYLDFIAFGLNNDFDYTVIEDENEMKKYKMKKVFNLVEDFDSIVKALDLYLDSNNKKSSDDDLEIEIKITIEEDAPVKKNKSSKVYDVVEIYDRFVRIGWDVYDIYVDVDTKREYVFVGNFRYEIKKDIFGRKYLA